MCGPRVGRQQALVDALGNDPRVAGALAQLLSDVSGRITLEDVRRYQAGRVEAAGSTSPTRPSRKLGERSRSPSAFATGIAPVLVQLWP